MILLIALPGFSGCGNSENAARTVANEGTGIVTTVAGAPGIAGQADGTGSAARFYNPGGITTDGTNLYVTDTSNYTVRQILYSTVAS